MFMYKLKVAMCLLVLSLLAGGCTGMHKSGIVKTQSKQPKPTAMQKLGENKMDVVLFLNRAEHVFDDLYYAAADNPKGKTVYEDGVAYRELPKRFDSKEKILSYFSRFWSRPLAESMYNHLATKLVKEKVHLALPKTDYPVLISVRNTTVQKKDGELNVIVEDVTNPAFSTDRTLRYRLVPDSKTKRFEIKSRTGTYGKELFQ